MPGKEIRKVGCGIMLNRVVRKDPGEKGSSE